MPHLLIIGGTGVLGTAAATHFLDKGFQTTVFVRDKNKAAPIEKKGAAVIVGDLTRPSTITDIFNGVDLVLTAAHAMLGKGRNKSEKVDEAGHKLLIDAAKQSGVRHFIYTSLFNAAPDHAIDFFRTKYALEQYLSNSGLNYSILRLPAFMEWHAYNLLGKNIVEKGKTTIPGTGNNPANFIAVKDILSALDVIALNETYYGKIITLAGPQNFSRNQIAELFGRALNIKPKTAHLPVGLLKVFSVLFRPFHPGISRIMKLSMYTENSDETMDPKYSIEQFGLTPTTMEEFIRLVTKPK